MTPSEPGTVNVSVSVEPITVDLGAEEGIEAAVKRAINGALGGSLEGDLDRFEESTSRSRSSL